MTFVATSSQHEAITTVDCPLAVTAGAGSGKTRVLVERYLYLLEQGVTVDQIAAITFTKKAAQEMKERLRRVRPDLIESLERAQISTIHSLCQRIIQEHPLQAEIDPRFRVGEEWETRVLLMEAIDEVVAETDAPSALGTPFEIADLVFELYETMLSKGDLRFNRPLDDQEPEEFPLLQLRNEVEQVLRLVPSTPTQQRILDGLRTDWPSIWDLLALPEDDLRLEGLELLESSVKGIRGKLADEVVPLKELIISARQVIAETNGRLIIAYLGEVLEHVHRLYSEKKRLASILDFNDLEQLTLKLLQDPLVRADYPLAHLMVDEFQDTNPMQKKIVDALVAQGAILFVVGDPKQSIYRFRGADVGVFVQTKAEIASNGKNVFLEKNFRSRPELIHFTNSLFEKLLAGESIGFEASLPSKEPAGKPCVAILHTPAEDLLADEARALEAQQIALKIRELVDSGKYKYEQISILFRAMTSSYIYEKALKEAGIPYVNLGGRGFYSKQEIQDVLHFFRWLEDPHDAVAQFAVLRSPFYLISDEGLYWLRQNELTKLTYEEQKALEQSQVDYEYLRELARHRPAPEVITALLERTNYLERTWRLPFGPQKVVNIEKLLEQSWDLFAKDLYTIPEQLRFLRIMTRDGQKEGEAQLDAEHADVVVLRTIHNSKGLEFPVVFLPDTNASVVRRSGGSVLYHPEVGLTYKGMRSYDLVQQQERLEEISEAKRLLYVAITRAEEQFFWCARDGKESKDSWWTWLQSSLSEIPSELYELVPGVLESQSIQSVPRLVVGYERPSYEPLEPQYHQVAFSVTSLMNYVRCPRYYYLRYVLGVPERRTQNGAGASSDFQGISATQRGNIVHRVCEQIRRPEDLVDLVNYAAAMEGVELNDLQRAQLMEIITPYLHSEFFQRVQAQARGSKSWIVYQEKDFAVPAGEFLVNGLVDQVFLGVRGLEVVDFKSNWIRQSQVMEVGTSYEVQLRLYAWAMAREFGRPVLSSQAYFLIPNQLYSLQSRLLDVDQTEKWVIDTCQSIIAGSMKGVEAFPIRSDCTLCPQNSYCNAVRERAFSENDFSISKEQSFGENTDIDADWAEEEIR